MPNVFAEFGAVFIFFVLEVTLCPASLSLKAVTARPTYKLFPLLRGDICSVYETFGCVFAWEGAVILFSVVAGVLCVSSLAVGYHRRRRRGVWGCNQIFL